MERALAHDLNNVLQTIAQAAELIAPGPESEPALSIIGNALAELFRAARVSKRSSAPDADPDKAPPNASTDYRSVTVAAQADLVRAARVSKRCDDHFNHILQAIAQAADQIPPTAENTPLTSIIRRSVGQARRIMDDAAGRDPAAPLNCIVHDAAQFVRDFNGVGGGPAVSFAIDVSESVWVRMPPAAIERTLVNLFVNASEAARLSGRDSVRIEVTATAANSTASITIRDNGPGIPETALPHIFEPGYSSAASPGSGLGLQIVQAAVTSAGGEVSAANRAGSPGAEFTLRIPTPAMAATA